jgi:N-carbamoyl-L-amino-acid hydrolase
MNRASPLGAPLPIDGRRLWADLMALAEITEPDRPYTRRAFTPRHAEGRAWLAARMRDAGLEVRTDAAGNLLGRRAGRTHDAPTLMLGSHSDTVPDGGRFDGIAGVIGALEVARALAERQTALEHALEVVDFLAEEPSEFGVSCVGSRGMVGALDAAMLARTASAGEALAAAIDRAGGSAARIETARRSDVAAFLELHIEQGPLLEARAVDFGVVTAIVGITRVEIALEGEAAHAGTTAMALRRDAAAAGAEAIVWIRERARALAARGAEHFVATVGAVDVRPGATNVVPRTMRLVVDARSERRELMEQFVGDLRAEMAQIAARERVVLARFEVVSDSSPAACDPALRAALESSARALGHSFLSMASGAGHDAAFLSRIAPMAMLFVPCRGGRSHCPEEWAAPTALADGAAVLLEAVLRIDAEAARR